MMESAADRGRRIANQRLGQSCGNSVSISAGNAAVVEKMTPSAQPAFPSERSTDWHTQSLSSEVETLALILRSKDAELDLLKRQLCESTRLLTDARSQLEAAQCSSQIRTDETPTAVPEQAAASSLLESFSNASPVTLNYVLSSVEKSTGVRDIHNLHASIVQLVAAEQKYQELAHAAVVYLRLPLRETSHIQLLRRLSRDDEFRPPAPPTVTADEVKSKRGLAWTFK